MEEGEEEEEEEEEGWYGQRWYQYASHHNLLVM